MKIGLRADELTRSCLRHECTAAIYRESLVPLDVDTVKGSPTMFSRRLIENIACGGLAVSTPPLSTDRWFGAHFLDRPVASPAAAA